jgi:hypothetical protein
MYHRQNNGRKEENKERLLEVIMNLKAMPAVSWPGKSGRAYLLSIGERINWQKIVGRRRNAVAKSDETDMRKRWGKKQDTQKALRPVLWGCGCGCGAQQPTRRAEEDSFGPLGPIGSEGG